MVSSIGYNPYSLQYRYSIPFRGADSIIVQENSNPPAYIIPNNTTPVSNISIPNDTVTISAGNKINELNDAEKKKTGIPTAAKWVLGILGAAGIAYISHRVMHTRVLQKQVQDVFLKDFSKEEALALQKKYRDILKIDNKDEFIDKMFLELKRDYQLENIPFKLDRTFKSGTKSGAIAAAAHFFPSYRKGYLCIGVDRNFEKDKLFKQLTHEMRHAKQDLLIQSVGTKEEFLSVFSDRIKNMFKSKSEKWIKESAEDYVQERLDFYNKLGIKQLDKNDRNYEWARKVLESYRINANASKEAYSTTFYETDAKFAENQIWRMINNNF